jgi:hypothetical protein
LKQTLSVEDENKAKILYKRFQREHPGILNPTDLNSQEKLDFRNTITLEDYKLMQTARKQAYSFTRL